MKNNKKKVIVLSSVLTFVLSITLIGYFQFFGPISVNLEIEEIDQIGFMYLSNDYDWQTTYVDESAKSSLLQELHEIKYRKTMVGCRCVGEAFVLIEYLDESQVKFDGFYFEKTSSGGKVTNFPLRRFDEVIAQLYNNFIVE